MKTRRRAIEVFSMSFLDVISCGFGAIILLLVLALGLEPATLKHIQSDMSGEIKQIEDELDTTALESQTLQQEITQKNKAVQESRQALAQLKKELQQAQKNDPAAQAKIKEELQAVVQTLTEEMRRLLSQSLQQPLDRDAAIGGIPVDSEYIVFVIDTSGSMQQVAWPLVVKKVEEVLNVYPHVKGLQVVNDMGSYMFGAYAGQWIPDTPARRKEVIRRLRTWQSFSNSSPVEGIQHAVRVFFRKGERISLYVFGDDFSSGSIDSVLREVARINKQDVQGKSRVRIHTFGFPVLFTNPQYDQGNKVRFAHLMRLLAEQNAGSFVGLNDVR